MEFLASPQFQQALASILLISVTGFTGWLVSNLIKFLKSKTSTEQIETLRTFAALAVLAAEQGQIAGFITDKKQAAINAVNIFLTQAGITGVNAFQIDAAIEAAVFSELDQTEAVDGN